MTKHITAVVLAGGTGRRFWPITTDKILFPFMSSPFVQYASIDALPDEISRIVIVANPVNRPYFASRRYPKPHAVVFQSEARGMADALLSAEQELAGQSVLVLIGDVLVAGSLFPRVIEKARQSGAFGVVPAWKPPSYYPGGYLTTRGERVIGIVEKPGEGKEPGPYINISGHFISDADLLLRALKRSGNGEDVYERTLTALMAENEFVMVSDDGPVTSLKYPWHILDVTDVLLRDMTGERGKHVELKQNVEIQGNVWMGDNVTVYENTKIIGPTYIGDGTIIGSQNIIRHSHIGKNCVTGFNTDITRSYIGDGCWFHSNYIGDSVLEGDVTLGAGAVLANVRLDDGEIWSMIGKERIGTKRNKLGAVIGKNVHIGVNVSIMPGVKIGSDTFIGAGVVLDTDMGERKFVHVRQSYTAAENRKPVVAGKRNEFRKALKP